MLPDIFPGKNQFANWIKRLFANILTFPLLAILFLAGGNITAAIANSPNAFLPPPLSGMTQTVLSSLVAIGILISIPAIIDRIKKSIIPEYTLVNFPTTPAAVVGTIGTMLSFLPTAISAYSGITHGIRSIVPKGPKKPGGGRGGIDSGGAGSGTDEPAEIPHWPHIPSGGGDQNI